MRNLPFAKTAAAALAVAAFAGQITAANATTAAPVPIVVTATVLSTCVIVPTPITFASYSLAAQNGVSSTIAVTCTPDVAGYQIALDNGTGAGANSSVTRKMTSLTSTDTLNYNLYRDTNRTQTWGSTKDVDTVVFSGNTLVNTFTVYAALPAGQYAPAGAYKDTVTVSLLY